jgi:hypothetical protein
MPTKDEIDATINYAKRLAAEGRYEAAEAVIDRALESIPPADIAKAKRQMKADAEEVDDTWSEVGDDTSDDGDGADDGDEQDDDGEEEDTPRRRAAKAAMDQIEDEVDRITKALRHGGVSYPHSETTDLLHHQNLTPPPATSHSARSGTYQTGVTEVVQEPSRHAFDDLVDHIAQRDRVSRMAAMSRARIEDPRTYTAYQRWHATGTAQEQETSRGWSTDDPMSKMGTPKSPPIYPESDHPIRPDKNSHRRRVRRHDFQVKKSYTELVREEMQRGCNEIVAGLEGDASDGYGHSLEPESAFIAKGAAASYDVQSRFHDLADGFVDFDAHSPRCEAMRKARLCNERLYKAYQRV